MHLELHFLAQLPLVLWSTLSFLSTFFFAILYCFHVSKVVETLACSSPQKLEGRFISDDHIARNGPSSELYLLSREFPEKIFNVVRKFAITTGACVVDFLKFVVLHPSTTTLARSMLGAKNAPDEKNIH